MLRVFTFLIAIVGWYKIVSARHEDEALGYLLISPLLTIPLIFVGNSGMAALYAFDVALLLFALRFFDWGILSQGALGKSLPGYLPLITICILAVISSLINWAFVEPDFFKYYSYCTIKYFEFAAMATMVGYTRLRRESLQRIKRPVIWCATIYTLLLLLHLTGVVSLGGEKYYTSLDPSTVWAANDTQSWFLAAFKAQIGANVSVCAFCLLALLPVVRRRWHIPLFALLTLMVAAIAMTTSRSDLAGIAAGSVAFVALIGFSRGGWRAKLTKAFVIVLLVIVAGGSLMWSHWDEKSRVRIAELWDSDLRAQGNYRDRQFDAKALPAYMIQLPVEAFVGAGPGNYARYVRLKVTRIGLGHNAYRSILGELGWLGLGALLVWCYQILRACGRSLAARGEEALWAASAGGLLIDRMVASWSADSLLSPMTMGGCNVFAIGAVYMLLRLKRWRTAEKSRAGLLREQGALSVRRAELV